MRGFALQGSAYTCIYVCALTPHSFPACSATLFPHWRYPAPLHLALAESSVTWREYQDARAAERESRNQDAQAQAMRAAIKEAAEAGATGAEAEERGKAAAAAAAASFKVKTKVRKSGGGQASRHPRGEDE